MPNSRGESILTAGVGFRKTSSVAEGEKAKSECLRLLAVVADSERSASIPSSVGPELGGNSGDGLAERELFPRASSPSSSSLSLSEAFDLESFGFLASLIKEAKDLAPKGFRVT